MSARAKVSTIFLMPLVALITMGDICDDGGGSSGQYSETPPDAVSAYIPEYDHMVGYDVLTGYEDVVNAFSSCRTDLNVIFDDVIYPAFSINFNSIGEFMTEHAQLITGQSGPEFACGSYLLAVLDAYNKPILPDGEVAGITFGTGSGFAWAVIFVQVLYETYPGDQNMINKTPIHELGHMRANLTELCYKDYQGYWHMGADHDDQSCVMGQGKIAICTGWDVTANPHFCPKCCNRLSQVQW